MGVKAVTSNKPIEREPIYTPGSKHPEPLSQPDTMESAGPIPDTAPAKWTPPSCLARYCTYVKNRLLDFFDWVCSLFCSSKAATEKQMKVMGNEFETLSKKIYVKELLDKRYTGVTDPSKNDAYRCLADYIEFLNLTFKVVSIMEPLAQHENNLKNKQNLKSESVLTERQLRADHRHLNEIMTSIGTWLHSDLPKKTTSVMIEKVKAFSLGKSTASLIGKTISLVDEAEYEAFPIGFRGEVEKLINEIRDPVLEKFDQQIQELRKSTEDRYRKVTFEQLEDESQAVHVLADCIAVVELCNSLIDEEGDISEESLAKRIDAANKHLAQPVLGKATPEMRKKVKEHDFSKTDIVAIIYKQVFRYKIGERLREVVKAIQNPQETQLNATN